MAKLALTDLAIQRLKPQERQVTFWDTNFPSFGVRVSKRTKSFVVMYGKERRLETLGRYPDTTLKDARNLARGVLASKPDGACTQQTPFLEAIVPFLERSRKRLKPATHVQYRSYLQTLAFDKAIGDITKLDITKRLQIYDGKPWSQNYAYATLRAFLNWCLEEGIIDVHPLIRGRAPNKTRSRSCVLTDEEMGRVWRSTDDDTYGRILRLLILTGQRRMEVRNIKPEDIADGLITFHTKGDKINIIPVTPLMENNLIVPFKFNNWSTAKARFDNDCGVDFRHHDLRRTLSTKLAQLGVSVVTIDHILGHSLGGVVGVYNRYSYIKEIREALLLYEEHLRRIVVA